MIKLQDVADKAGVSKQLVSLVLNGKGEQSRISKATQKRVQETARELGYDPDNYRGARQLIARRYGRRIANNVIAVSSTTNNTLTVNTTAETNSLTPGEKIFPTLHSQPYQGQIMEGIETAAYLHGLDVLVCRHFENKLPRILERREVDGIICVTSTPESILDIKKLEIPAVVLISQVEDFHNVLVDNAQGTYLLTQHLISLGHRQIAYVGHRTEDHTSDSVLLGASRLRFQGYLNAMEEAGIEAAYVDKSLKSQTGQAGAEAAEAAERLWKKSKGTITAFVFYNDVLAMGATDHFIQNMGLNVPEDVSVAGFDDFSLAINYRPALTSIYYDRFALGKKAVEWICEVRDSWLEGKDFKRSTEILPVELKIRESTAPPKR